MKKLMTVVVSALSAAVSFTSFADFAIPAGAYVYDSTETGVDSWSDVNNWWVDGVHPAAVPASNGFTKPMVFRAGTAVHPNGYNRIKADVYLLPGATLTQLADYLYFNDCTVHMLGGTLDVVASMPWSQTADGGLARVEMIDGLFRAQKNWNGFIIEPNTVLKGGTLEIFKAQSTATTVKGTSDVKGTEIIVASLTFAADARLRLYSGRVVPLKSLTFGAGSSFDFVTESSAEISLPFSKTAAAAVYAAYFADGKITLNGAIVPEEDFSSLFTVGPSPDSADGTTGLSIKLTNAGIDIPVPAQAYSGAYDGADHPALDPILPAGASAVYSLDGGDYASEIPTVAAVGEHAVAARYTLGDAVRDVSYTVVVSPRAMEGNVSIASIPVCEETGSPVCPKPAVTDAALGALVEDVDFVYEYENNVRPGTATCRAVGKGNYAGSSVEASFTITDLSNVLKAGFAARPLWYAVDGRSWSAAPVFSYSGVHADEVTFTYALDADEEFSETAPSFSEAGDYVVYCRVQKGGVCAQKAGVVHLVALDDAVDTYTWIGGTDDDWSTAANWLKVGTDDTHAVPNAASHNVIIQGAGAHVTCSVSQPKFQKGLYLGDGGSFTFTGTYNHFENGGSLHLLGGAYTNKTTFIWLQSGGSARFVAYAGEMVAPHNGFSDFRLNEGTVLNGGYIAVGKSDRKTYSMNASLDLKGSTLDLFALNIKTGVTFSLYSGKVLLGYDLWRDATTSHYDFVPYSSAVISLPATTTKQTDVYAKWFAGETPMITYNGAPVAQADFDSLFEVTASPDSAGGASGVQIRLRTERPESIIAKHEPLFVDYDGEAHDAVASTVLYPAENTSVSYRLGDSGAWSTAVPRLTDIGAYAVWTRVRDLSFEYEEQVESHVAVVTNRSLVGPVTLQLAPNFAYTGKEVCPKPVVTDAKLGVLTEGEDYALSYVNNIEKGVATCFVDGCGKFRDRLSVDFNIVPLEQVLAEGLAVEDTVYTDDGQNWWPKHAYKGEAEEEVTFTYSLSPDGPFTDEMPEIAGSGTFTCYIRANRLGAYAQKSAVMTRYPMPTIVEEGAVNCWLGGDGRIEDPDKWSLGHAPKLGTEILVMMNGSIEANNGTFRLEPLTKIYVCHGATIRTSGYTWISKGAVHLCGGEIEIDQIVFNQNNPTVRGTFELLDGSLKVKNYFLASCEHLCLDPNTTMTGGTFDTTGDPSCTLHSPNVLRGTTVIAKTLNASGGPVKLRRGKLVATVDIASANGGSFDLVGAKAVVSLPKSTKSAAQVYQDYFATGIVTVQGRVITEEEFAKRIVLTASPDSADGTTGVAFSMKPTGLLLLVW